MLLNDLSFKAKRGATPCCDPARMAPAPGPQ